ncbi:fluoride efflux transporter CrcB [Antrihabitans sp. YC2-6]|uniref:fluoride efflux transporter CrcB n=1 Tax=Antrihabitans sp. YC2-6 TaxID=2799498 RepID=UPI001F2F22AB|nr:fluoride efflux transporter CrcB [Antrihabitans sp. YC2-6]
MNKQDVPVLGVIAIGGGVGALARYGVSHAYPPKPGGVPWSTLFINGLGCFLIGILVVLVAEMWAAHRLWRPFLGVGILGGFTTFSTYTGEVHRLFDEGEPIVAFSYLFGTVAVALVAVLLGTLSTRAACRLPVWRAEPKPLATPAEADAA